MKKRLLAIILSLCLCMGMMSAGITAVSAAAADSDSEVGFDPNNYKGKITKISVKEPYTKDGITYLPMEVNFHVNEDISDSNSVYFMEGYNNVYLADGRTAESLPGVGNTLIGPMKPDVSLEWNNQFIWKWNGGEDGGERSGELADPEQCAAIAALGIDLLAAGIGNVHGAYPLDWKGLDFPLLDRIRAIVAPLPLVLHGGSGIPDAMVRSAIQHGIAKINVNSECREAFSRATRILSEMISAETMGRIASWISTRSSG